MVLAETLLLILLHGVDGQEILINPQDVVTLRPVRPGSHDHIAAGVHCLIHTADGKVVTLAEDCQTVQGRLTSPPH